ncbi:odorant receptor 85f isoform X1 [Drosophila miranda]|uniref:odorant receptor 85f isoform X1 n=1 Tax=Drosophila miranda TaxID=7229 RepID=UPI00143F3051|nr:odorant receptor 85f isoform X1 [Drosophila miranda]
MESVQRSYEDFPAMPSAVFRLMGYNVLDAPDETRSRRLVMWIYRWLCTCSHAVCVGFMIFRIFEVKTIDSIPLIMRYVTLVTYVINSDTKHATAMQRDSIRNLNKKLADLYPKTTKDREYYRVNEHYWSRSFLAMIFIYIGSSIMVVIGPILQSIFAYFTRHQFTYEHCYPYFIYDPNRHPVWVYIIIYATEWLHSTHMVISNVATDLWLLCFQVQICMHFSCMTRSLEEYQPDRTHDGDDNRFLAQIVNKHEYLVILQNDLNGIFGGSLLLSLITTSAVICTVSVYSLIQGLTLEGITYVFFIGTSVMQLFLVCNHGQQLLDLGEDIGHAAYNHNWHKASIAYKKYLLIIIIRAQKPVELSAMGYLPISRDTFKQASTVRSFTEHCLIRVACPIQLMSVTYRGLAMIRQMIE